MTGVSGHDHAWSKVEGLQRGLLPVYRCGICEAEWPASDTDDEAASGIG